MYTTLRQKWISGMDWLKGFYVHHIETEVDFRDGLAKRILCTPH